MKDLYNSNHGVILFCIIFILSMYYLGKKCPCNNKNTSCTRKEFYGVQFNHFVLYIILGILFPSYFFTLQILGILFELVEYYLDKNDNFVKKYIGGCLKFKPKNENNNELNNYTVYRNIPKYLNPIDKFFKIKNSTLHAWHGSVAEVFVNIIGFILGYIINYYIRKYYFSR